MPITVLKVGKNPKKPTQARESVDVRTFVRSVQVIEYWRVVFSGTQSDPSQCFGATDGANTIPVPGDSYLGGNTAWAVEVLPQLDPASAGQAYEVQVTYVNVPPPQGQAAKWNAQISFDGVPVQESTYYDLDGNQITNSASQLFATQPMTTYYDTAVKISFDASSFDETDAETLRGQVNAADIEVSIAALSYQRTFPAGTLRLDNFSATPLVVAGTLAHWHVEMNLTYRPLRAAPANAKTPAGSSVTGNVSTLAYDLIPDMGYAYYDSSKTPNTVPNVTFTSLVNGVQMPCNAPCLLDGAGGDGRPTSAPTPNDTHYIAFRLAQMLDFTPLFAGIA